MDRMDELARCLRRWRDRMSPAEAGLANGGRRRAPGLRRAELAQLAGLSVDYLARLEQGRAHHPSASVLVADAALAIVAANPLARALLGEPEGNIVWRHFTGAPSTRPLQARRTAKRSHGGNSI
jgi:hypothetical protein